jgi:hypothetical protein
VLRAGRRRNDARMWSWRASSATPARATPRSGKRRDRSESTILQGNPRSKWRKGSDLSRWVRFRGSDLSQDRFFRPHRLVVTSYRQLLRTIFSSRTCRSLTHGA